MFKYRLNLFKLSYPDSGLTDPGSDPRDIIRIFKKTERKEPDINSIRRWGGT